MNEKEAMNSGPAHAADLRSKAEDRLCARKSPAADVAVDTDAVGLRLRQELAD
jgi:hypothetical protein